MPDRLHTAETVLAKEPAGPPPEPWEPLVDLIGQLAIRSEQLPEKLQASIDDHNGSINRLCERWKESHAPKSFDIMQSDLAQLHAEAWSTVEAEITILRDACVDAQIGR